MNLRILCQNDICTSRAHVEVAAEGTSYGYQVCTNDVLWAKRQIQRDFPARRITVKTLI